MTTSISNTGATAQTSPCTLALIRLLEQWPRNHIAALLLDHPEPEQYLLSGELQLALPARWRRSSSAHRPSASPGLGILDEGFPELLRNIPDPPLVLFYRGAVELLGEPAIAMVGARRCTAQGRATARKMGADLVRRGLNVVSGLALGVDGAAHEGALSVPGRGRTVAVLGGGLQQLYPKSHTGLARRILSSGGLLVSEYPDMRAPLPRQFPERNRIISGLSAATVVVEAGLNSGSLITARFAAEQGRDVFALPGPVNNATSRGCHRLIQQGAGLVVDVEDLLLSMGMDRDTKITECGESEPTAAGSGLQTTGLSDDAEQVLGQVGGYAVSVDELAMTTGMDVARLTSVLVDLELRGFVRQGPTGYSRSS